MRKGALSPNARRMHPNPGNRQFAASLSMSVLAFSACLALASAVPLAAQQFTATVGNQIANPIYVNLYWDDTWDKDNPSMPTAAIDSFMKAILASSYFSGLAEYGIQPATYGGGFLPAAACPQTAPVRVGYYDPFSTSIMGFLNCELQKGSLPIGNNVVYNIMLPAPSLESDLFGAVTQCQASTFDAWHFHATPYNPVITATVLAAGPTPGAQDILAAIATFLPNAQPVYTITSANQSCGPLFDNLLHEMIEAASDPFPPVSTIATGDGEIADKCENVTSPVFPFVPPTVAGFNQLTGPGASGPFATNAMMVIPEYWSNKHQICQTGFDITSVPGTPISVKVNSGQGPTLSLSVSGSGFGLIPPPFAIPANQSLPYIAIQDNTQGWQAGNSLDGDVFGVNVTSWSNFAVTINGIANVGSDFTMLSSDSVSLWLCNPASSLCGESPINLPASANEPNLSIVLSVSNPQQNSPYVSVSIDGKGAGGLFGDGNSTSWIPVSAGTHTIKATTASSGTPYTITYSQACNAQGQVTVSNGQNKSCLVGATPTAAIDNSGCSPGTHCCGAGAGKCLKGQCVSDRISCP